MKIIEADVSLSAKLLARAGEDQPILYEAALTLRAETAEDDDIFAQVHSLQMLAQSLVEDEIHQLRGQRLPQPNPIAPQVGHA